MAFAYRAALCACSILLAAGTAGFRAAACDLKTYSVEKGIELTQSDSGPPIPRVSNGYVFRAEIAASGANNVLSATVTPPPGGATVKTLVMQSGNEDLEYDKKEDAAAQLNSSFPNGTYVLSANTAHEGSRVFALPLQWDTYPTAAYLLGFDAAQDLDAGAFNTMRWGYLADGAFPDYAQLRIEDSNGNKVFETADRDDGEAALNGSANFLLLPRGTLAPNQVYRATLKTRKTVFLDSSSCPTTLGWAAYYRRVAFDIRSSPVATAADVETFALRKIEKWEQAVGSSPVPASRNGYVFEAELEVSYPGSVLWTAVGAPQGTLELTANSSGSQLEFKDTKDTKNGLDTAFPAGSYVFNVSGATDGLRTASLQVGADAYPAAPVISNAAEAQTINAGQDFMLRWAPFTGGTSSDFIQLQVDDENGDKIFETPDVEKAKALTGLRTSATLPAGTLAAGRSYTAKLLFLKVADLNTAAYAGALGVVGFGRETRLTMRTAGGPAIQPQLSGQQFVPGQGFSFWVTGNPGSSYRVEASPDLVNWGTVGTVTLLGSQAQFLEPVSGSATARFYRAFQP